MKGEPSSDGDGSLAEVLEEFDVAVRRDEEVDIARWLKRCPDADRRSFAEQLLRVGCEARGFDFQWLADRFSEIEPAFDVQAMLPAVLRLVAADEAALGRQLRWRDYARFEIDSNRLQLRGEGDSFFLGQIVGHGYRLDERIGAGGFGVVYRVTALHRNDLQAAVKSPRRRFPDALEAASDCLQREAASLQSLRVEGVPEVYELGEQEGIPFFAMELVEGSSIAELLRSGPLDWRKALQVAARVGRILDDAHRAGHLHGDVKLSNVFLTPEDRVYVLDWGSTTEEDLRKWNSRTIAGTLMFQTDEVLMGLPIDADVRQDVYALALLLFVLLTNETPPTEDMQALEWAGWWKRNWFSWYFHNHFPPTIPATVRVLCGAILTSPREYHPDTAADFAWMCEQALAEPEKAVVVPMRPEITSWRLGIELGRCGGYMQALEDRFQSIVHSPIPAVVDVEEHWRAIRDSVEELSISRCRIVDLMTRLSLPVPLPFYDEGALRLSFDEKDLTALRRLIDETKIFLNRCADLCRTGLGTSAVDRSLLDLSFATVMAVSLRDGRFVWLSKVQESHIPREITDEFSRACRLAAGIDTMFHLAASLDYRVRRFLRWGTISPSDEQVYGRPVAPQVFVCGAPGTEASGEEAATQTRSTPEEGAPPQAPCVE